MSLLNKIKWKVNNLYYNKLFKPIINFKPTDDFTNSVVKYSRKAISIEPATTYNKSNNNGISLITLANEPYVPLLKMLLNSLAHYESKYDVTLFDIGLSAESIEAVKQIPNVKIIDYKDDINKRLKDNPHPLAQFLHLKLEIITGIEKLGQYDLKLFSDSACMFVGKLDILKNFATQNGFFAGITQTRTYEWGMHHAALVNYWQQHFPDILNPDYYGLETGFMLFNIKHDFSKDLIRKVNHLFKHYPFLSTTVFPFDQVLFAVALNQVLHENKSYSISLHPNTRAEDIINGKDTFEKNALWRRGHNAPLFGYVYHNNSTDPNVIKKRYRAVELDYTTMQVRS